MGRPRKTISELKKSGAYRADRHGNHFDESAISGKLKQPTGLSKHGKRFWKDFVQQMPDGYFNAADSVSLYDAVKLYEAWATALEKGDLLGAGRVRPHFDILAKRIGFAKLDRLKLPNNGTQEQAEKPRLLQMRDRA